MTAFLDRDWGDAALADFSAMVFPALLQSVAAAWLSPAEAAQAAGLLRGLRLKSTEALKLLHKEGQSYRAFDTGLAISIFRDNSTRTRFSWASAASGQARRPSRQMRRISDDMAAFPPDSPLWRSLCPAPRANSALTESEGGFPRVGKS